MHWIHNNPLEFAVLCTIVGNIAQWLFGNFVASLPTPEEIKPLVDPIKFQRYQFRYKFLHALAGNLPKLAESLRTNPVSFSKFIGGKVTAEGGNSVEADK
jgi:hypothetical protein